MAEEAIAYRPAEALEVFPIGRSALYQLLRTGEVQSFRVGRARFIPRQSSSTSWSASSPRSEGRGRPPTVPSPPDNRRGRRTGYAGLDTWMTPRPSRTTSMSIVTDLANYKQRRTDHQAGRDRPA
jgi:hypothetical protein